jgi:tRNA-2-methylthio-N6-dimethylallyladenosine synthase
MTDQPEQPARPKRVWVETYGCQMNVSDTELMVGGLLAAGYEKAESLDDADVILLNTCAVREKAEDRIYGRASQLLRFKYTRPDLVLGITGCMAEHLKEKIVEKAPYIDLVVGPDAYRRLPELVATAGGDDPVIDVRLDRRETYDEAPLDRAPGVSGWITIQRGCDKFCTFCIVPYTRGRERGTAPREVLRQAHDLASMGYREVTLLGQTVNSYRYEDVDFADLLRAVHGVEGIRRIRYTSPYPVDFTPKLIATLAELDKVPPYLHLPVQSGADSMLERMKRGYTIGEFRRLVDDLRAAIPNLAMSTDIIVGFPDETDAEFEATVALIEELQLDFAFLFAYSEREGTYASRRIPDTVPDAVKKERLAHIIALQEKISARRYGEKVGQIVEVLAEGPSERNPEMWYGKSADFKTTIFPAPPGARPGALVDVLVERATSHSLGGRAVAIDGRAVPVEAAAAASAP